MEPGRRKSVGVPAQIGRQPFEDAEPACAMLPLKPARRNFANSPSEPVSFDEIFDTVTEAAVGLDDDHLNDAPREKAKAVTGVVCWQTRKVAKRKVRAANQDCLEQRAPSHAAA